MSIKEYIYFNKKKIIIFIGIGFVFTCGIYLYFNPKEEIKEENIDIVFSEKEEQEQVSMCYFDIKGEVKNPGVYFIECDKRVNEKTTTNMIQKINPIFTVNPLISKEI